MTDRSGADRSGSAVTGSRVRLGVALAAGVVLAVVYLALASAGDLRAAPERFLAWAALAAVAFAVGSVALVRSTVTRRTRLGVLWVGAIGFRLVLLPTVPSLSDDVWRYLWDGHVAAAGIDPFLHAPEAPELRSLRNGVWERVNHREVPTIYPPAAQLAFRIATGLGGLGAWKGMVLAFDLATLAAIVRVLGRSGRDPTLAVAYAWNPLVVIELAGNAHVDALAVAASAWAIALLGEGRERWALGLLTVGIAAKVFPIVLLPLVVLRTRDPRSYAVPIAVGALLALPYLEAGARIVLSGGLATYAAHWEFNAPIFEGLRALTGSPAGARRLLGATVIAVAVAGRCGTGSGATRPCRRWPRSARCCSRARRCTRGT